MDLAGGKTGQELLWESLSEEGKKKGLTGSHLHLGAKSLCLDQKLD